MWFRALWVRVPLPTPEKRKRRPIGLLFFFSLDGWDSNNVNTTVRWTVGCRIPRRQHLNFCLWQKCKRVPYPPAEPERSVLTKKDSPEGLSFLSPQNLGNLIINHIRHCAIAARTHGFIPLRDHGITGTESVVRRIHHRQVVLRIPYTH